MKTDLVLAVVKELAALLKQWGAAFLAFWAGRKAEQDAARKRADKAAAKQEDRDREFEALDRNDDLTRRMRELRGQLADDDAAAEG